LRLRFPYILIYRLSRGERKKDEQKQKKLRKGKNKYKKMTNQK